MWIKITDFLKKHKPGINPSVFWMLVIFAVCLYIFLLSGIAFKKLSWGLNLSWGLFFPLIIGFVTVWGLINTLYILRHLETPIYSFAVLLDEINKELQRLANINTDSERQSEYLIIVSFTPALGNISVPAKFANGGGTYKFELLRAIANGITTKLVCFDQRERCKFHLQWAKKQEKLLLWENQVQEIFLQIRGHSNNKIEEVKNLSPIAIFSTSKKAFQFVIKQESKKNEVLATKIEHPRVIQFIESALEAFYWGK